MTARMPLSQFTAIRAGDVIRTRGTRRPRLVLSGPKRTRGGAWTGVALFKIGHAWTDPWPIASYDAHQTRTLFEVTGRRMCSEALAEEWYTWHDRLLVAALARRTIPKRPQWPRATGGDALPADSLSPQAIRQLVAKYQRMQDRGVFAPPEYIRRLHPEGR